MIERKNILDEVNFQIRRKGYDTDEVRVFIQNLYNKYVDETLKVDNLSKIIVEMERVIKDNLEKDYDEDKSLIDIVLEILLENKKYRYRLEEKQKRLNELEEKVNSLDKVQNKVMEILASAKEFKSQAEEKAKVILAQAEEEAKTIRETVQKQAEEKCSHLTEKCEELLLKTKKEVNVVYGRMKDIVELYYQEIDSLAQEIRQLKENYIRILYAQIEKIDEETEFEEVTDKIEKLRDSIRNLEYLVEESKEYYMDESDRTYITENDDI